MGRDPLDLIKGNSSFEEIYNNTLEIKISGHESKYAQSSVSDPYL